MESPLTNIGDFLTDASPPMALSVGLFFLGMFLKRSPMSDWLIPIVLAFVGAVVYPFIAEVGQVSYTVKNPMLFNAVIGFGIGAAPTACHQTLKQWQKSKGENNNETTFIKRPSSGNDSPK